MNKILFTVCLCFIFVLVCSEAKTETGSKKNKSKKVISLLIGLIPEQNVFKQIKRYEPLFNYLSEKIKLRIESKVLTQYGNIIDNFTSLGLDGAFFGSFTYTIARTKLNIEIITRPESTDGISTYHGLIFVKKESGINGPKDMAGKRFAFVDKATTAGYLFPLVYFKEKGIKDYNAFFKETYFTGTHEDAVYDVLNNRADVGAAKNTVFFRLAVEDSRLRKELVILERSTDVPENSLAVRKDLDISIKKKLKQVLLNMHNDPDGMKVLKDFGAKRFIETTDGDYASVYEYAQEIGLNLETYDYMNE